MQKFETKVGQAVANLEFGLLNCVGPNVKKICVIVTLRFHKYCLPNHTLIALAL